MRLSNSPGSIHIISPHALLRTLRHHFSNEPSSPTVEVVVLLVHMDCPGCERTVRKALSKLKGIHSIEIDRALQKVTVTGYVDKYKVLHRIRRKGKLAQFWPLPEEPLARDLLAHDALAGNQTLLGTVESLAPSTYPAAAMAPASHPLFDRKQYLQTSGYGNAGYGYGSRILTRPPSHDDPLVEALSDDNPNNCSIM